jgi:hypothetical protein
MRSPRGNPPDGKGEAMKKPADKKRGTLKPWLVDVMVEHLR